MDAQTLFREGVQALRDKHDAAQARQLLSQSLKLDPNNDMAWLWLARTTDDPRRRLQCVERALSINPNNPQALALREKLRSPAQAAPVPPRAPAQTSPFVAGSVDDLRAAVSVPPAPKPALPRPTDPELTQQQEIDALLAEAEKRLKAEDVEGAIEQWVNVLDLQVDQPVAIQNAVRHLFKLGYKEDASELIERAINAGTTSIPIYLTGIDLARVRGEPGTANDLRERVALLPNADDDLMIKMVDYFLEAGQSMRATELLEKALAFHPDSQALLLYMADFQENTLGSKADAVLYYERAARIKTGGKAGKRAEQALRNFTPVITDRERGSIPLAVREAVGFGAFYLLMAWQDAGLNLIRLGAQRWLGVGLSIIGGYLLVSALSSPQQKPLAAWFGGHVPENPPPPSPKQQAMFEATASDGDPVQEPTQLPIIPAGLRAIFAAIGLAVLVGAFLLVFSMSIQLLLHPVRPHVPSIQDLLAQ